MWQREPPKQTPVQSDLSPNLEINLVRFSELFKGNENLKIRRFTSKGNRPVKCAALYTEGLSSFQTVSERIVRCIMSSEIKSADPIGEIYCRISCECDLQRETSKNKICTAITYGDCVLFVDGCKSALIANAKSWVSRPPTEPENEKVLRGPREGFTEKISDSVSLIQRRLCTPDLKINYVNVGRRSNTRVALCYLESLAKPELIDSIRQKLSKIDVDGVIDSNYITELIAERRFSTFKTVGATERPDTVCARLLEGRAAIIVNGSPEALTMPYFFIENFQSADDYFINWFAASLGRILRLISFILAISIPAVYVALVTVHKEMMPTNLALSIISARASVPFPVIVEALGLITVFEIIRETALRMPSNVSQAFSIVGAIVIGDSAVKAKFVSVPIVIIVSLSALTGLMIPRLRAAVATYRIVLVILSGALGLYGYMLGIIFMTVSLIETDSFGTDYTSYLTTISRQNDIYLRLPWHFMKKRPRELSENVNRQTAKNQP